MVLPPKSVSHGLCNATCRSMIAYGVAHCHCRLTDNNHNTNDNVYGAVVMVRPLQEFTQFI